ncbi:MATE family efflux transporter, partial [Candidatus Bipolaricaulota bacterium]|nr:MATE family efflux transporter [Candidatus Bipolaricaulota bacterium]
KGLLSWFITDPAVVAAGVPAVRMVLSSFVLYGVIIMIITHFQAIGKGSIASTLTVARILGFFLPLVLTLPHFLGLRGVWLSVPLADGLTALVALGVLVWEFRRLGGLHRAGLALQTET